mgnify:CR=1 FL=1
MRTLQLITITLCFVMGSYLLSGRGFFMPSRWDPSIGVNLVGWSARLLGAALLTIAVLGLSALRNFGSGTMVRKSASWHRRYFAALVLAITMIAAALMLGEQGPTPGWRGRSAPPVQGNP